jgi:hypothetical protein
VLTGRHGVHEVWNSEQPDKLNFMWA